MPDWYVRRNDETCHYPYQVRLGGCEYSLTHEEWAELATAFRRVDNGETDDVESEDYQDLKIANSNNKRPLDEIMKIAKPVVNRRGL